MKTEIGQRLKKLRTEKGMTQKELAARVDGGLDYTYIGKIERGDQLPSLKILLGIGQALGVPAGYFFRDEAAAAVDLLPSDLRALLREEKGRELIRALRLLKPEDLPLVTELIRVLHRHRGTGRIATTFDLPLAAEEEDSYGKK